VVEAIIRFSQVQSSVSLEPWRRSIHGRGGKSNYSMVLKQNLCNDKIKINSYKLDQKAIA